MLVVWKEPEFIVYKKIDRVERNLIERFIYISLTDCEKMNSAKTQY